ncbi:MAG: flavin monoamine oxidase family protein, partial [Dehalococcoidia bacterium]
MTGKTPLLSNISRLIDEADRRNRLQDGLSRRHFLRRGTAALAAGAALAALPASTFPSAASASSQPKITIVGAGIAGLNAAWYLQRAGLNATVYEGSDRIGGRIWSGHDIMGPGLTTEIGGEFIDSGHKEMLRLTRRFDLDLIDVEAHSERDLIKTFHFGGASKTEDEVIEAFRPLAAVIAQDQQDVVLNDYTDYNERAFELDHTALSDYLTQIGATGFIRDLLDVAYLTEYGCETEQQSALNLVFLIGTKTNHGFQEFGASDQRCKVMGGNDRVTSAIANDLDRPVRLGHRLVAVRPDGDGFICTFETASGVREVATDVLLLTLPFSVLRHIDLDVTVPTVVRRYIDECGYGTNSKLVIGFDRRYWRDAGKNGLFFTDLALQSGWDSSQLQPGHRGSLTVYTGGDQGVAV